MVSLPERQVLCGLGILCHVVTADLRAGGCCLCRDWVDWSMFALGVISVVGNSLLAGEGQMDSSLENESYGARGGGIWVNN